MALIPKNFDVRLIDLEPVKEFFASVVAAYELLDTLTPKEADTLPDAVRQAAAMIREAVHEGRAASIIGDPDA